MIVQSQIQERISEAIAESGMPQREIAKRLGVSQQMISNYKNGTKMPALDTFANLCAVLDADPAYLLCLKN